MNVNDDDKQRHDNSAMTLENFVQNLVAPCDLARYRNRRTQSGDERRSIMPLDNSETGLAAATRSVRWMCGAGHFIFGWSAEEDAKAERLIQQKMDEGVTFWITRNTWRGDRRVALTTVNDLPSDRRLIIEDDDIRAFLESSADAGVLPDDNDEDVFAEPPRRTKSAKEAAQNDTIAHRPLAGG